MSAISCAHCGATTDRISRECADCCDRLTVAERVEQGLPPHVEDLTVLSSLAGILAPLSEAS